VLIARTYTGDLIQITLYKAASTTFVMLKWIIMKWTRLYHYYQKHSRFGPILQYSSHVL